jgi:hypothetical protein
MPRKLVRPKQIEMRFATWGGARKGAGRKSAGTRAGVPHRPRAAFGRPSAVHVTLRVLPHVWNLRTRRCAAPIEKALQAGRGRFGFRVVHYSVQGNHVHLLAEAESAQALRRGVQGLSIRIARALNKVMGRTGKVLAGRYHAESIAHPRRARWALRYVLCNARKHGAQRGERHSAAWLDPFSSARWFDGWRELPAAPVPEPGPILAPRIWLLTTGWRRHGLIGTDETPSTA